MLKIEPIDVIVELRNAKQFLGQAIDLYWKMNEEDRINSEPMQSIADEAWEMINTLIENFNNGTF